MTAAHASQTSSSTKHVTFRFAVSTAIILVLAFEQSLAPVSHRLTLVSSVRWPWRQLRTGQGQMCMAGVGGSRLCMPHASKCWCPARTVQKASRSQRPLEMYVVDIPELKDAKIAITPCPGKRERDLGTDLDQIQAWGAQAVVTLMQDAELAQVRVSDMKVQVSKRSMQWFHCPVPDFSGPGLFFEGCWVQRGDGNRLRSILRKGGQIVVHCRGGIGRAGTITARLLIELGVADPREALLRVREVRPGAVETWDQEKHVLSVKPIMDET